MSKHKINVYRQVLSLKRIEVEADSLEDAANRACDMAEEETWRPDEEVEVEYHTDDCNGDPIF